MKLCIDLCHPAKSGAPPERHPVPASLAKAVRAASHPTNDLPARRPFPTRPSTFSPARSCHLPTPRQASAVAGLGGTCKSPPARHGHQRQAIRLLQVIPLAGIRPAPQCHTCAPSVHHLHAPPNRPPKSRGATPRTPHTGCTYGAYKTRAKASLSIVSELLALYTFCIQNTGFSHANASQTVL
jgi:hypothetical protein